MLREDKMGQNCTETEKRPWDMAITKSLVTFEIVVFAVRFCGFLWLSSSV